MSFSLPPSPSNLPSLTTDWQSKVLIGLGKSYLAESSLGIGWIMAEGVAWTAAKVLGSGNDVPILVSWKGGGRLVTLWYTWTGNQFSFCRKNILYIFVWATRLQPMSYLFIHMSGRPISFIKSRVRNGHSGNFTLENGLSIWIICK